MSQMQDPTKDPIAQAVQFAVATNLMPKDPAVEAFKSNAVKGQIVEQIKIYKALRKECKQDWLAESSDILSTVNGDRDHPSFKSALADYTEENQGWKDAIKALQAKLK